MSLLDPLRQLLKRPPRSPEDVAAQAEAKRIADQVDTIRLSQRSGAGQNYQSGRGLRG
jgi:hypothetical protein